MRHLRNAVRYTGLALRRLHSLVRDVDHDDWLDRHAKEHDKPTNLAGPWSQGGG